MIKERGTVMDNNFLAHKEYNKLIKLFEKKKDDVKVISNSYNDELYPVNYGGAFYDSELQKLIIYATDESFVEKYKGLIDSSIAVFKESKYSLVELLDVMKVIYDVMIKYCISKSSLIQRSQRIIVYGSDKFERNSFVNFINEAGINPDCIEISEKPVKMVVTSMTVKGGDTVYSNYSSGDPRKCTVGCNAYKYVDGVKKYGVITAGHICVDNLSASFSDNDGNVFSTYFNSNWQYGGMIDAAFLKYINDFVPTKKYVKRTPASVTNMGMFNDVSTPLEGTTVVKYGVNTGRGTGTITSVYSSYNVVNDDNPAFNATFYGFFDVQVLQVPGDSGGPVGIEEGITPVRVMSLQGIATHATSDFHTAGCCRASMINANIATIHY